MKLVSDLLPMLFVLFFIGCATAHPGTDEQDMMPDDFSVAYEWRAGSLPPPSHYEYTITIKPTGQSEIVLTPDYPGFAPPKWTETFKVEAQSLHDLYRVMVENALFTKKWRRLDGVVVGGSKQTMVVTVRGKRITVKDHLVDEQEAPAEAMYSAVKALVPKEIWDRLQEKRKHYMEEHPRLRR
ncbi:MAG: hypothetical protein ACRD2L_06525 [Terriglobia bacterium]